MKRTQLYLPENLFTKISRGAEQAHTSIAEFVRSLLFQALNRSKEPPAKVLIDIAAAGTHGPKNLSKNIDKILYKPPTKK